MNGATRIDSYFWCIKLMDEESLITRDDIRRNMAKAAAIKEQAKYEGECPIQMLEMKKRESIKKRIFRRFFPWKKN